jgi:hypothetical protein
MPTIINGTTGIDKVTDGSIVDADVVTIAASKLTGALPAIDGSGLTGISSGGITLLDTVDMSTGTTVTSAALVLTDYKFVIIDCYSISPSTDTTGFLRFTPNGGTGTYFFPVTRTAAGAFYSSSLHNLASGFFHGSKRAGGGGGINDTVKDAIDSSDLMGHNTGLSTATTTIAFDYTTGETFDGGTIRIYGSK